MGGNRNRNQSSVLNRNPNPKLTDNHRGGPTDAHHAVHHSGEIPLAKVPDPLGDVVKVGGQVLALCVVHGDAVEGEPVDGHPRRLPRHIDHQAEGQREAGDVLPHQAPVPGEDEVGGDGRELGVGRLNGDAHLTGAEAAARRQLLAHSLAVLGAGQRNHLHGDRLAGSGGHGSLGAIEQAGAGRQEGRRFGEVHTTTTGAGSACSTIC